MPELPEVETVTRGMQRHVLGHAINSVTVWHTKLRRHIPPDLKQRMEGNIITRFRRRAKYICMDLSHGDTVMLHLGMSGRVIIGGIYHTEYAPQPHEHFTMETAEKIRISYIDPRRFGSIDIFKTDTEKQNTFLKALGPEPLDDDFSVTLFAATVAKRPLPIKHLLLNQRVVAGLGNIYVCEALFRAKISPLRQANQLNLSEITRLHAAIRCVLKEAIQAGGSSLRDYVQTDGKLGYFQHKWAVYGKEGQACGVCASRIQRIVQSGRSTFYCPSCQRVEYV